MQPLQVVFTDALGMTEGSADVAFDITGMATIFPKTLQLVRVFGRMLRENRSSAMGVIFDWTRIWSAKGEHRVAMLHLPLVG